MQNNIDYLCYQFVYILTLEGENVAATSPTGYYQKIDHTQRWWQRKLKEHFN